MLLTKWLESGHPKINWHSDMWQTVVQLPVLIIVLLLGLNDVQPLITHQLHARISRELTSWVPRCYHPTVTLAGILEAMLPVIGCYHPNVTLTTSWGLCLGDYVSRCWVYHLSHALIATWELCSLMYSVPPPHLILEEDSRYLRNVLGTLMVTYWLLILGNIKLHYSNLWYPMRMLIGTYSTQNLQGGLRRFEG
jgi:hypothetical protein